MKKDFKNHSLHPTDEELADFIDKKLDEKEREEMLEHLIYCDDCSDIVFGVMEKQSAKQEESTKLVNDSNQPQVANADNQDYANNTDREPETTSQGTSVAGVGYANNWFYSKRVRAIVFSGLVASLVLFVLLPSTDDKLMNDLMFAPQSSYYKSGSSDVSEKEKHVRGDVLSYIKKVTDLNSMELFQKAEKEFENENFDKSHDLYREVLNEIDDNETLEEEEKLRKIVLLNYKLFRVAYYQNKESKRTIEYRNRVQTYLDNYNANYQKGKRR